MYHSPCFEGCECEAPPSPKASPRASCLKYLLWLCQAECRRASRSFASPGGVGLPAEIPPRKPRAWTKDGGTKARPSLLLLSAACYARGRINSPTASDRSHRRAAEPSSPPSISDLETFRIWLSVHLCEFLDCWAKCRLLGSVRLPIMLEACAAIFRSPETGSLMAHAKAPWPADLC